jgi:Putative peptidoglycan binding domain
VGDFGCFSANGRWAAYLNGMERPPDKGPGEDDWVEEDWLAEVTEETPPPRRGPTAQPQVRRLDRLVVAAVAAAALILIIVLAFVLGGDDDGQVVPTTPTVTPTETAPATTTGAEPSQQVPEGGALTEGDSGRRVRLLQRALATLGYEVTPDGEYGPATTEAVSAFQEDSDLDADGVAGAETIAAINEALAAQG